MVNFENWIGITCDTWLLQLPRHLHWTGSSQLPLNICHFPSRHSDVVTTLSQRRGWRCHNVVARSKMRVVATSVSDVVTTLLSDVVKTLPQRCYNVATTLSIWFLGHFITDNSDFFPAIETWESYKSTWVLNLVFGNSWLCLLLVCEQDKVARLGAKAAMKGRGRGKKCLQHNTVNLFLDIPTVPDRWSLHFEWTWNTHTQKY